MTSQNQLFKTQNIIKTLIFVSVFCIQITQAQQDITELKIGSAKVQNRNSKSQTKTVTTYSIPDTITIPSVPQTKTVTIPSVPQTKTVTIPSVPQTKTVTTQPSVPQIKTVTTQSVPQTKTEAGICYDCDKEKRNRENLRQLKQLKYSTNACGRYGKLFGDCKNVPPDKRNCKSDEDFSSIAINSLLGCGVGSFDAIVLDTLWFIWDIGIGLARTVRYPIKSFKESQKLYDFVQLYVGNELNKAYDESNSTYVDKGLDAFLTVVAKGATGMFSGILNHLFDSVTETGCLTPKARSDRICYAWAMLLKKPVNPAKVMTLGVKVKDVIPSRLVERLNLSQKREKIRSNIYLATERIRDVKRTGIDTPEWLLKSDQKHMIRKKIESETRKRLDKLDFPKYNDPNYVKSSYSREIFKRDTMPKEVLLKKQSQARATFAKQKRQHEMDKKRIEKEVDQEVTADFTQKANQPLTPEQLTNKRRLIKEKESYLATFEKQDLKLERRQKALPRLKKIQKIRDNKPTRKNIIRKATNAAIRLNAEFDRIEKDKP